MRRVGVWVADGRRPESEEEAGWHERRGVGPRALVPRREQVWRWRGEGRPSAWAFPPRGVAATGLGVQDKGCHLGGGQPVEDAPGACVGRGPVVWGQAGSEL